MPTEVISLPEKNQGFSKVTDHAGHLGGGEKIGFDII